MAFRLRNRRSIRRELRRLVSKEFRTALNGIAHSTNPDETALHEARKSVKRIRAVLRLVRNDLGAAYETENERLRSAAHHLAALRDADATVETIEALHARYPTVVTHRIARQVVERLQERKQRVRARAGHFLGRAAGGIRRARKSVPGRIRRVGRFAVVRTGIVRGYRQARLAMADVTIQVEQTNVESKRRERNDRLAVLPLKAPRQEHITSVFDLPDRMRAEIEQFFLHAVVFEGKDLKLPGWEGTNQAEALVREAVTSVSAR